MVSLACNESLKGPCRFPCRPSSALICSLNSCSKAATPGDTCECNLAGPAVLVATPPCPSFPMCYHRLSQLPLLRVHVPLRSMLLAAAVCQQRHCGHPHWPGTGESEGSGCLGAQHLSPQPWAFIAVDPYKTVWSACVECLGAQRAPTPAEGQEAGWG
ncbi:hypothetical protein HaLaN_13336 [Haematococcus lacustris]|uniref:Uncharacterized protein n=1 Tax=Haematococcus lacustris TaxID=44745 RepID=A0A699ZM21_HAELA|nr:hypothetical protein HaLaN_13336 [Haematococcus lacustris]